MKYNIKVSIITPCLNSEKTIRDTIESVLYQTYPNIEYIIVDGLSTDSTMDIVRQYIPLFNGRLKYVSEKDKGIYNAMNKGIKISSGEIIGILNSDDYYEKNAVEKIIQYSDPNKCRIVYGYMNLIKHNSIESVCTNSHIKLKEDMIPHSTCFVSRKAYVIYGLFLEWFKMAADYELMLRFSQKDDVEFLQVKEIISNFRVGGTSYNKKYFIEADIAKVMHGAISVRKFLKNVLVDAIVKMGKG